MNGLNNLHKSKVLLDEETGEVKYLTNKEVKMIEKSIKYHFRHQVNNDGYSNLKNFKDYINNKCGSFYFNYYNTYEANQYIFRFMYLCTYMNYKGFIELGNSKNEKKLVSKADLKDIFKMSEREFYNTTNYLLKNNLITIENDKVKVNSEFCIKGEIDRKKEVIRMFDNAIRDIYLSSKPREHKKLSLLIKILPLIHFDTNVVCKNPEEEVVEKIQHYNLTELAELTGYSTTQRLKRGLMDLRVNNEAVIMIAKINNKEMIVVNPKVYYKGNDLEKIQGIINIFEIAK